jgi:hypothetical protein
MQISPLMPLPTPIRTQGDMVEYNQCQSMLSNLYDLGLGAKNRDEFAAYRILMFLHGLNRSGGFP